MPYAPSFGNPHESYKTLVVLLAFRQANALDMGRLLLVSAIWGSAFVFIELALRFFGPLSVAALRITMAALVLLAIAYAKNKLFILEPRE